MLESVIEKLRARKWLSVAEAAEILEITKQTMYAWCSAGKVSYRRDPRTKKYKISVESIIPILRANKTIEIPDDVRYNTETPEKREIIGNRALSKLEAERIIKQEEAIKKQRENLEKEGKIIYVEKLDAAMSKHYRGMLQFWEEKIDSWGIKYGISPSVIKEMHMDFKESIEKWLENMKEELSL